MSSTAGQTFETWHTFGDATLQVRTAKPTPISAQIADTVAAQSDIYSFATNESGITAALSSNGQLLGSAISDKTGIAQIKLQNTIQTGTKVLLTLTGFNIFNLGVFAKALMSQRYSGLRSRTISLLRSRYTLECGLLLGAILILAGIGFDAVLLTHWLQNPGVPMETTVHSVFVATTSVVLGGNLVFGSFLLNLTLRQKS